ncbi:MAG TPA: FmdB family zinc ribbon protein [Gemmatimonadaceae bacterium]
MPLYEFRCPSGHNFEKFYRSISSAPSEEKCPECGQLAGRLISPAGLIFKGSGFYITDYGKDGKKQQQAPGTAAPKAESGSDAKPAESKPAADAKPAPESKPSAPARKSE